jgi:hypothetical protein
MQKKHPQRKVEVVTSFSDQGYKIYGERFLSSFQTYWPEEIKLAVYCESVPQGIEDNRIVFRKLTEVSPRLLAFKERHKNNKSAHGLKGQSYSMHTDAVKFSHKVFACIHASQNTEADILIWVDADTLTHSPISTEWLRSLLPEDKDVAWLNRDHKYPECGFLLFNTHKYVFKTIFRKMEEMYLSDNVFNLPETHDSYIWWYVMEKVLQLQPVKLSGEYSNCHHPFVNVFGHVMDHLKGIKRKQIGRSFHRDLKAQRTEGYWTNA